MSPAIGERVAERGNQKRPGRKSWPFSKGEQIDNLFDRAEEEARLAVIWRQRAEALRSGGSIAGVDRRRALALARRCEATVVNISIAAERAQARKAE